MTILFDHGSPAHLICPHCGSAYLHHGAVRVFDRTEDQETVRRTKVANGTATMAAVPNAGSGNPSNRRDGITIEFSCEGCDQPSVLSIAQHKGQTEMGWKPGAVLRKANLQAVLAKAR